MHKRDSLKKEKIGQSAAKLRTGERSTTSSEMNVGSSEPKWSASKSIYVGMMNNMVCALVKAKESL